MRGYDKGFYGNTIEDIKHEIYNKYLHYVWFQALVSESKVLTNDRVIESWRLNKDSYFYLIICNNIYRNINIDFDPELKLKAISLKIWIYDLIEDIKFIIQDKTGINAESIKLYLGGYELLDSKSILELGLPPVCPMNAILEQ